MMIQGELGLPGERGVPGNKGMKGAGGDQGKKGDPGPKGQPVSASLFLFALLCVYTCMIAIQMSRISVI